eukprot:7377972-Prymnesium_polylepis.1
MVLAAHLNEINYAWRLDPMNHAPHFPYYVTAMVDIFPVNLPTGGGDPGGCQCLSLAAQISHMRAQIPIGHNFLWVTSCRWLGPSSARTTAREFGRICGTSTQWSPG